MESVATHAATDWGKLQRRVDWNAVSAWVLTGALVLYMAFNGGGYSLASHGQAGLVVWWVVVVCAIWGLLPVAPLTRAAWTALTLLFGFVAWTALATTWSISSGRSLQDLSLVSCYLGFFVLGLAIHRERKQAVAHTVSAVATAITLVAAAAIAARLWPHLFAGSQQTGQFLPGARARISWPLNYWNGLGAFVDLGIPLLLAVATSARSLRAQALAAGALPLVVLCAAMTVSRGAMIAGAVAVLVFFALAPERLPKLATGAVVAGGSAILIAATFGRYSFQKGLLNAAAAHQAHAMVAAILIVCAGAAVAQLGIGLAVRHGTPPRLLRIGLPTARVLLLVGIVAIIAAGIGAGVPGRLSHAWHDFKVVGSNAPPASSFSRFGATSGDGRYQYWVAAVHATSGHVADGSGPGTFQQLWLPRASFRSYAVNAHSLYVETYAEEGIVGLALLVGFLLLLLGAAVRLAVRSRYETRTRAAGIAGAIAAFAVYAAFDWIWQIPVIPAVLLLLGAAALAPSQRARRGPVLERSSGRRMVLSRMIAVAVGVASIFSIIYPLATSTALTRSQSAVEAGNLPAALADARQAAALEPTDAAARLQIALVLELGRDYRSARAAALQAVKDEPRNWSNWLILSRLQAESGNAHGAVAAYLEAKSLNPTSPLFRSAS